MNLPKSWHQISYRKFLELLELDREGFEGFEKTAEQLAILLDTDSDDDIISEMNSDEFFKIRFELSFLSAEMPKLNNYDVGLTPINLNSLKIGEFIDIDYYINKEDPNEWPKIMAILFRKTKKDNIVIEPYIYDIELRSQLFYDIPVTFIWKWISEFVNWRSDFLKKYENLFMAAEDNSDEELTGYEKVEKMKEDVIEKVKRTWAWERILYDLSGGDITKFNGLYDISLILTFNILSMKSSINV